MNRTLARRSDFLRPWHQAANILNISFFHMVVILVFWKAGDISYLPLWAVICLPTALIHQRAMSEWIHEASHYNLVSDRTWNDRLANVLCNVWMGTTIERYRSAHLQHHAATTYFDENDPDTRLLKVSGPRDLAGAVVRDLTGITAIRMYLDGGDQLRNEGWSSRLAVAAPHAVLIGLLAWLGRLDAYVGYYLSLVTLYPLLNRIRLYGQHVTIDSSGRGSLEGSRASRCIDAGLLDRLFFTSKVMMFHDGHHSHPGLPFRALEAMARSRSQAEEDDINTFCRSRWLPVTALISGFP